MFTSTNLLVCWPTLCNLYQENLAFSYQYLVCVYHLCCCCRHFTLAVWLTTLLSICKFHNMFQWEAICPLVSKHLHQACLEGFEPVDRQNRCSLDKYVRFHFPVTTLYIMDKKPTRCHFCVILYFSFTSCSTCFGQPSAHLQELTTA